METEKLASMVEVFEGLEDWRNAQQTRHVLSELLTVAVCAVLSGADDFEEVSQWGRERLDWLRGFLTLDYGVASPDTFERVFALLDPKGFEGAFRSWVGLVIPALGRDQVIAIDGKTSRRTTSKAAAAPLHMVSAFAANVGIVLGQTATAEKSNEITAIPELLRTLDVKDCIVTIDAMGTQTAIAHQIRAGHGNYVLCVKDNHPKLLESILLAHARIDAPLVAVSTSETRSRGHGREEVRRCQAFEAGNRLYKAEQWRDLRSFAVVERSRTIGDRTTVERRHYISSLAPDAEKIAHAVRSHWEVESVPQAHSEEGSVRTDELWRSCTEDEGRPLGVGFQERASNHPKLLCSRDMVVSVGVKASGTYPEQVRIRETNESEPSMTRRYPENCRQNQGRFHLLGPACRRPGYWASGGRRIGGVKLIQASVRNCGNQSLRCQGRSTSGRNHEARVPMRSTGTDRPVVVMKAGNAAGAKGSDQAVAFGVQLATGGDG